MNKHELFQQFFSFTTSVHSVTYELTKNAKDDSITALQYSILEYIAIHQPVTLSQISECLHMSMPNTSRELKKLNERQLCEKVDANEDRRKQYIHLAPEGQVMMSEAFQLIEDRFMERIKNIPEEELAELEQAMKVLHTKVFN